ncbi:MAG: 30S ribosomal protein S17 [Parcubacteria group bacterium SW_4_46_8]|nr:MAG: 30S ribosomal protein S17 [Parcubacteria group bacterium SW_4_46_8]
MSDKTEQQTKRLKGTVVSDGMDKTVVVQVNQYVPHKQYLKYIKKGKRIHAHDEENAYSEGDTVILEETRPISKKKKFRVVESVAE